MRRGNNGTWSLPRTYTCITHTCALLGPGLSQSASPKGHQHPPCTLRNRCISSISSQKPPLVEICALTGGLVAKITQIKNANAENLLPNNPQGGAWLEILLMRVPVGPEQRAHPRAWCARYHRVATCPRHRQAIQVVFRVRPLSLSSEGCVHPLSSSEGLAKIN